MWLLYDFEVLEIEDGIFFKEIQSRIFRKSIAIIFHYITLNC